MAINNMKDYFLSFDARFIICLFSNLTDLIQRYGAPSQSPPNSEKGKLVHYPTINQCRESLYNTSGLLKQCMHFTAGFLRINKITNQRLDMINVNLMQNLQEIDTQINQAREGDAAAKSTAELEEHFKTLDAQHLELLKLVEKINTFSGRLNEFFGKCKQAWEQNEREHVEKMIENLEKELGLKLTVEEKSTLLQKPTKPLQELLDEIKSDADINALAASETDIFPLECYAALAELRKRLGFKIGVVKKASKLAKRANRNRKAIEEQLIEEWENDYKKLINDLKAGYTEVASLLGRVEQEEIKLKTKTAAAVVPKIPLSEQPLPKEEL